jgi:hybrid cluster-associated redox disulfide protein
MDTKSVLQPQMTVEEVLTNWPDVHLVFLKWKTKCVGCFLQRFCTLKDVADTYRIPLSELLGELREHVQNYNQI